MGKSHSDTRFHVSPCLVIMEPFVSFSLAGVWSAAVTLPGHVHSLMLGDGACLQFSRILWVFTDVKSDFTYGKIE